MNPAISPELLDPHFHHAAIIHYLRSAEEDHPLLYVSSNIERLLGLKRDDFLTDQRLWLARLHPEDQPGALEYAAHIVAGGSAVYEYRILDGQGVYRWLRDECHTVTDDDGKPQYFSGFCTDITAQIAAQDTLRHTQEMLKTVLDHIPQRVFWKDTHSVYLGCNRAYAEERELINDEEIIGKNDFDFHIRADAEHYRKVDAEVIQHDQARLDFIEQRHPLREDETVRWVRTSKIPLHDPDGGVIGVVGIYADITEEKQLQEKLQDTLQQFQTILDTAQVGILYLVERKIVWANACLGAMFGYQPDELLGQGSQILYNTPADYQEIGKDAYATLYKGFPYEREVCLRRKSGQSFWCHVRGMALNHSYPEKGAIWVILDIEKRKEIEQELVHLNTTLMQRVDDETAKNLAKERLLVQQARHAAMGEMIGNIAHQWRQPLNLISLILQNIVLDYTDQVLDAESLDQYSGKALKAIRQMSATIDDFRNFFRPDRIEESFEISLAVQEAVNLVDASLRNNNIVFTVNCPDNLKIWGHRNELAQVFLNLIGNAKDALLDTLPPQPRIDLTAELSGDHACIRVRDNAGGVPAALLEKIFDPYFTTKEKGTGIGLYMTRTIVEQHMKGRIELRNTDDGAEFSVFLPLCDSLDTMRKAI